MIEDCAIIGAGAIGASLGELLSRTYDSVRIIATGERAKRYSSEGFVINEKRWIPAVESGDHTYDLVIIAVKFNQFHEILPVVDKLIGEHTQILSLLNGLVTEEILIERYGSEHVLYSFTVGQDALRLNNSIHYTLMGRVVFGEIENDREDLTERVSEIERYLCAAGVNAVVADDMIYELWWKFMVNVGINQASAYLERSFGEFQKGGESFDLMKDLMEEVITLSQFTEHPLSTLDFDRWVVLLMTLNPLGKPSMYQDFEAGRKSELGLFAGTVLEKARELGLSVPANTMVYEELAAREMVNS